MRSFNAERSKGIPVYAEGFVVPPPEDAEIPA